MDVNTEFWSNSACWSPDTNRWVFLTRALHEVGRNLFGERWKGDEPMLPFWKQRPSSPPFVSVEVGDSTLGGRTTLLDATTILGKELEARSDDRYTREERELIRAYIEEHNKGHERFAQAVTQIILWCRAGRLEVGLMAKGSGVVIGPQPITVWQDDWRSKSFFARCTMDPDNISGTGFIGKEFRLKGGEKAQRIFLARESLDRCIEAHPPKHVMNRKDTLIKEVAEWLKSRYEATPLSKPLPSEKTELPEVRAHFHPQRISRDNIYRIAHKMAAKACGRSISVGRPAAK